MTTEEVLNAALDAEPGDTLARLALADWLADEGRIGEAEGQRHLVAAGKFPHKHEWSDCWDWWDVDAHEYPESSRVDSIWDDPETQPNCRYGTRREAEADYLAHCRRSCLLIGGGVPS